MNDETTKTEPAQQSQTPKSNDKRLKYLEIGFFVLAVFLGFVHVWADHHYLKNADAMSYLDVAKAYLHRDWNTAINAYWGPMYSWLIAVTLSITKPSAYWEFSVLHLLNLVIFLFAFACFGFFIREVINHLRIKRGELLQSGFVVLPDWALLALGYSLFLWSSLFLITVSVESPDMLVASAMFVATGIVLRIRRKPSSWLLFALLGTTLGFGYLTKAVMLPIAFVFMFVSACSLHNLRRAVPRVAVTLAFFLLLAGPFIFALSKSKGRFTTG